MTTTSATSVGPATATIQVRAGLRPSKFRDYGIIGVLVLLFVVLSFASPVFLTTSNLLSILHQTAPMGIVAVGTTLVFIAGGFDFSIGSVYAIAGMAAAFVASTVSAAGGFLVALGVGLLIGVANGVLTTFGRVNPFVTTLATSIIVAGLATTIGTGSLITVSDPSFTGLGNGSWLGVSLSSWVFIGSAIVVGLVLQRTVFGTYVYAIGGNEEAARFAGVPVRTVRIACYAISGLMAALGGILAASYIGAGQANAGGTALAINAVAAIVIGGTSIKGGEGAVWRTVVGVLLLALITNGFSLLGVNANLQSVFQGALILTAVLVDVWLRRRRG